jgi:hypothetical protein
LVIESSIFPIPREPKNKLSSEVTKEIVDTTGRKGSCRFVLLREKNALHKKKIGNIEVLVSSENSSSIVNSSKGEDKTSISPAPVHETVTYQSAKIELGGILRQYETQLSALGSADDKDFKKAQQLLKQAVQHTRELISHLEKGKDNDVEGKDNNFAINILKTATAMFKNPTKANILLFEQLAEEAEIKEEACFPWKAIGALMAIIGGSMLITTSILVAVGTIGLSSIPSAIGAVGGTVLLAGGIGFFAKGCCGFKATKLAWPDETSRLIGQTSGELAQAEELKCFEVLVPPAMEYKRNT